ncbi:MAG: hypothetical protein ACE5KK_02765 [Candidatus Brocadiales bacterium]
MRIHRLICAFLLIPFLASPVWARECELEWHTPNKVVYEGRNYLVWQYQIKNNTDKVISVPVEVFIATDTGGRYHDRYQPEVEPMVEEGERYENAFTMAGEFQPHQTKKAIAYFENVDENAKVLYVYMTGLSHFFFWRWRLIDYSYRIVYKRSGDTWQLMEHGFSKDTTHRDYDSWKDTYPQGGPSTRPLIHAPDVRFQYEAPHGPEGKRQKMVDDFVDVFDAIFNANKTRNPKKAVQLWEAITDRHNYKEVDLQFPQRVYTWEEAWEKNKKLIDQTHARMTGKPFEKPTEALWQISKIDGYKELKDGALEIYTRFAMFYKKEYHYGLAVFKIKNTVPYKPIPSWRQYPYKSRWKIFDYRWKHISKPEYNRKLFAGYPKVKW